MIREYPLPNRPAGIVHRMTGQGAGRRLHFVLSGFSNAGSSLKDFWTVWFKEVSEGN